MSDESSSLIYRVWCEHEGCEFDRKESAKSRRLAQKNANGYIVGHHLDTGHYETYRSLAPGNKRSKRGDSQ